MSAAQYMTRKLCKEEAAHLAKLRRELRAAEAASLKASDARMALPPGSSRARVTTANSRWMRKAEDRDRRLRALCDFEDRLRAAAADVPPDPEYK